VGKRVRFAGFTRMKGVFLGLFIIHILAIT
jgi:hypothetical protein